MDCPSCGGVLKAVKEKRVGRYREEKVEVTSELLRCGECGEGLFTPTQAKEHNRNVKDQVRRKHGLLSPDRIKQIRERLGLTQDELEHLLGIGPKVVVRWENGKVIQGRGSDNVLRLLEQDPSVLDQLRRIQNSREKQQRQRIAQAV